jgi:8-oxo-dGTP pyrophosphatase MutT (NUDIX family)
LDQDDKILLLKRSPKAAMGPEKWGFPAGKIELGESPKAAATRELEEEIGDMHTVSPERFLGPIRDSLYGGQYEIYLFQKRWEAGRILLNHEHTDAVWVSPHTFDQFDAMKGIEEDIAILQLWPKWALDPNKLPPYLR